MQIWNLQGSKNSCSPIMAATLLLNEKITLQNCPNTSDVHNMIKLLKQFNLKINFKNNNLIIDCSDKKMPLEIDYSICTPFKHSYYIIGSSHQGDGFILNVPFCKINEFSSNFKLRIDYFLDHRMIFRKDLFKLIIFSNNDILNNKYIENYKNKIILKDKIELDNLLNKINEKYILLSDENLIIKNTIVLKEIKMTDDLLKEILNKYINIYLTYKL